MWGSRRYSGYNDYYREGPTSVASIATAGTAMTMIVVVSGSLLYCAAHKLVAEYGWQGALNYIWEGDPYPPHVRQYLDDLNEMAKTLNREENQTLHRLEEGLERAKLDTIDQADPATILATWEQHVVATMMMDNNNHNNSTQTLQKMLAKLSYNLDRCAYKIDSIILRGVEQHNNEADLKQQKKDMSNRVVQMMERTDVLLQFWKEAANS